MNKIHHSDCRIGLKSLPDKFVHCCVTSPPYYGLRDYGVNGQIGLEETLEQYINNMVEVFREVYRVLRDDGTLWVNIGDSYSGGGRGGNPGHSEHQKQKTNAGSLGVRNVKRSPFKDKDLIGVPWMLAFALRADGWYLRQDIIWHKPNPMPESVTDRCTKAHEYIFLLSKSARYYYDAEAIRKPLADASVQRLSQDIENQNGSDRVPGKTNGKMKAVGQYVGGTKHKNLNLPDPHTFHKTRNSNGDEWRSDGYANKRSVWTVTTKPFSEAHFATFPEDLIVDCIKAGCPIDGTVLDPFMGAGTTALVARKLNRNFIGFELNPEYIRISENRLYNELGMFQ